MEEVIKRFAQIEWSNLAFLSMRTERQVEVDALVLEIVGLYSNLGQRFELLFSDVTYLRSEVDFAAKRTCADAIDGAQCRIESPWKKSLTELNPFDNFDSYLHFEIGLVPRGGSLNFLARNFSIKNL